jgi:predicted O-methyltransferase YrrM
MFWELAKDRAWLSRCYVLGMSKEVWKSVDDYLQGMLLRPDAGLDAALIANRAAGLPPIDVAPNQGKLLYLLAQMLGARNILEIGTLGAYSTIWLARALPPGGHLITLEADPKHAEVARANLAHAGLAQVAEVRVGRALDTLPTVADQVFDLVFIDADKPNNAAYVAWARQLTRPGSAIIVDNVVREGGILDAASGDARIQGTRSMLEAIAQEPRLDATAIQTVGSKGHDGFVLARVLSPRRAER